MATQDQTTILSTKGQVILPKAVREHLHWTPGTRLSVEHTAEGVLLRPATAAFPPTRPEDVFGCLSSPASPKTIEQMHSGIAVEVKRRHARGRY